MSQLSFSSFDAALMVRDSQGHYLPATADQILDAARQAMGSDKLLVELTATVAAYNMVSRFLVALGVEPE